MSKFAIPAAWYRAVFLFVFIAAAGLTADLYAKNWAFQSLGMPGTYKAHEPELNATYWIWPNVFGFQTTLNPGALFGFAAGQIAILVALSLIFLVGIIGYLVFAAWRSLFLSAILGMITAGICGNLYDRLGWHGLVYPEWHPSAGEQIYAVRDWILCMLGTFHWPNFNIADMLLVCSVIILLIHSLLNPSPAGMKSKNCVPVNLASPR
ncbi:MAG: signal peptidase II [Planctomycetaceae bacterium]|nr:signal peptidase II [Planctomycetaceae bacterium]